MSLSHKDIQQVANLARLAVSESESQALMQELNNILELVTKMGQINTKSIEPMAHPYDEIQPLRADIITETNQCIRFQKLAPLAESGLYLVPQFVENEQ